MDFSKRLLMYETNSKTEYVDYGEIVSIINDKLVNINMGGQRDTNGQLVILEAVAVEGDYVAQIGDWVGVEWRSGIPVAIGGGNSNSTGLKNINDNVKIVSQSDMADGVINSEHIRTNSIEAGHIKAGSVQAGHISANAIQAQHISANSIDGSKIKADSINATHITANAITASELSANSVTAVAISANSVQSGHISSNSISANHIGVNVINAGHISANSINTAHISANAIDGSKIKADSINATHITANAIGASEISASAIQAVHISADAINATHITANAIGASEIAANAVQAIHISANAIQAQHISANAVQVQHISANTINSDHVSANAIQTQHISANSIDSSKIKADSINATHITANAIGASEISANAIQAQHISANAIQTGHISANSVNASHIVASAIGANHITANAINAGHVSADAINSTHITANAIGATEIAANAVQAQHVSANAINAGHISANSVQTQHISANSIDSTKIKADSINATHITANAIGASEIQADAINAGHISANSIQSFHITANAIQAQHISANSIGANHITANSIGANQIKADAINATHITANAIGATEISADAVQAQHISANAVQAEHISANSIQSSHISANSVNAGHIQSNAINSTHISAGSIVSDKIAAGQISGGHILGDSIEAKHLTVSTREYGLLAQYFTHTNGTNKFEVFKGTSVEPVLNQDWTTGSPSIVGQADAFAIRYQGMIFASQTGVHTFHTTVDDGIRLWIDNVLVIDGLSYQVAERTGTISLTKDKWYTIRIDFHEGAGSSKLKVEWTQPSTAKEVIPSRNLTPATTVIDGGTILTNTITASNIKVGTITAASGVIADAAIGTAHIISGNITSAKIANASVLSAHIADANILSAHIASANINDAHITTLNATKISAGFIASERIAANSISGNQIAANQISGNHIVGNSIEATKIKASSITAREIAGQTITGDLIQAGAVTSEKIRAQSITAEHISARGIDVSNSITVYNGLTGETLIGGGYLRVDGLDVGVVQSDNLLANGLFLAASSAYGLLKDNPVGETILGSKANSVGGHQVWKYNLATGAFITAINIEGKKPVGIAIDEYDDFAYVTVQGDNTLAQIDIANDVVTSKKLTLGMGPETIKYVGHTNDLGDHKHLIVLNTDSHDHHLPDSLMVIDGPPSSVGGDLYVHHEIPLGNTPYDFVLGHAQDGSHVLYVTQSSQGDIAVVDMSNTSSYKWHVKGAIPIAAFATDNYHGGLPSTFGLEYATGGDASSQYDATSSSASTGSAHQHGGYSASDGSLKKYEPKGIAKSSDDETLYVADSANNELVVVDIYGKAPYNGITGTNSSTVSPEDSKAYGVRSDGGPTTPWVRYRIPIGDKPDQVKVIGGKIYVTLQGSGQVAIINEQNILDEIATDRAFYASWNAELPMRALPTFTVSTIDVGSKPSAMIYSPTVGASGSLIITLNGQNQVAFLNIATSVVTKYNTGSNPRGVAITNDGAYMYVVNNGGAGDMSFIYPKGPFIGDPYVGLEGMVEYQGAHAWKPYRSDWVKDASGNIIASSTVEFRINEPFLNEGGYGKLTATGKQFQEAWIEQDIYNVTNYSNGNNVINTIAERLAPNSGNTIFYPKNEWLQSPVPSNFMVVSETSGNALVKTPASNYTIYYSGNARVEFATPVPSGNWVEADYTFKNDLYFKPHNGSVLIAVENSSSPNYDTLFQIDEYVPKFVVFDNQQAASFTPTADGISQEYTGIEYSAMTNRAKGETVTASATPTSGSLTLISDGLEIDSTEGDVSGTPVSAPSVTLPSGLQNVKIDLGAVYMINKVTVSHKYGADRKYHNTKTEVSEDGVIWSTVYDSAVSGEYNEKPSYHSLHDHTHFSKVISFTTKPVRYVRDWANGWISGDGLSSGTENDWSDIKAFGDWELETGYVYPSGAVNAGLQIATNGKGVITTDISKAYIAIDIPIEFTSWWYMTYLVGPEFGIIEVQMPTIMNSNHYLNCDNNYINKIAHRHIMSFPPSGSIKENLGAGIKAGKHRAVIMQESGKVAIDRFRFEDFQFYKSNSIMINEATTTFQRYKIIAEQSKWYEGQGKQSTYGAYDTPRTNPDTGLPDNSVPVKYRFRVKSILSADGAVEERGVTYITSAIMETGKLSTHWRTSAASDLVPASKLELWNADQAHKTGIQSGHIANGAIRGTKILPSAIMDYHISPYAKIKESKLKLNYPTHDHANKAFLDSMTGFIGISGNYGTGNTVARADHKHDDLYLGIGATAVDSAKLGGINASAYMKNTADTDLNMGTATYVTANAITKKIIFSTTGDPMSIYGEQYASNQSRLVLEASDDDDSDHIVMRHKHFSNGSLDIAAFRRTKIDLNTSVYITGNIIISGTVDGVDVAGLSGSVYSHIGLGGSTHPVAVSSGNAGFISGADQAKLNAIQVGAINQTTADGRYLPITGGTATGDLSIRKSSPILTLHDTNATTGSYPQIKFDSDNDQGITLQFNELDSELPEAGYGLRIIKAASNEQSYKPLLSVEGNIYAQSDKIVWHSGNFMPSDYSLTTHTHPLASSSINGLMSITDFDKLSAIQASAINQTTADGRYLRLTGGTLTGSLAIATDNTYMGADSSTSLARLGFWKKSGLAPAIGVASGNSFVVYESSQSNLNDGNIGTATIVNTILYANGSTFQYKGNSVYHAGNFTPSSKSDVGHVHAIATTSVDGFMSSGNVTKLNGIDVGAINQTTADDRYLKLAGGTLTGNVIINSSSDAFVSLQSGGIDKGKIRANTSGQMIISATGGSVYLRPNGDTSTAQQFIVDANGVTWNGNTMWHSNNFTPSNYYTKSQTYAQSEVDSIVDIRAAQANVFTNAGLAVKIQPSANVAGTTKLFQVANTAGTELVSINYDGDTVIKGNLVVQGTTQYAGTTYVDGDYGISGTLSVSGNTVLGNAMTDQTTVYGSLIIPTGGALKQIGKEAEVMRFPIYGIGGDLQFQTNSKTFEDIVTHYYTFNNGGERSCLPSVPTGATRKFKLLVSYGGNTNYARSTLRIVSEGTTNEVTSMILPYINGDSKSTLTWISPAFTTLNVGNTTFQVKINDPDGFVIPTMTGSVENATIHIKYIEVVAYDVY